MEGAFTNTDSFKNIFEEFIVAALASTVALSWQSAIEYMIETFNLRKGGSVIFAIVFTIVASIIVITIRKKKLHVPEIMEKST